MSLTPKVIEDDVASFDDLTTHSISEHTNPAIMTF